MFVQAERRHLPINQKSQKQNKKYIESSQVLNHEASLHVTCNSNNHKDQLTETTQEIRTHSCCVNNKTPIMVLDVECRKWFNLRWFIEHGTNDLREQDICSTLILHKSLSITIYNRLKTKHHSFCITQEINTIIYVMPSWLIDQVTKENNGIDRTLIQSEKIAQTIICLRPEYK